MDRPVRNSRALWLCAGVLAGLAIAYFWPHEPAAAITTDRNAKFALATGPVSFTGTEGVFVLDFLTGRLTAGVINNKIGKFTHGYYRNVAADFAIDPKSTPQYAIVVGRASLPSIGRATTAQCVVYVAELTSGKVAAYTFPYNESRGVVRPVEMTPLDAFPFREASAKE